MDNIQIRGKFILAIALTVTIFLISLCINNGHDWGDDFALYIEQAKSTTDFSMYDLYSLNKNTVQSSIAIMGPYLYPNGFPSLLAPVYYCFGINFIGMKAFCALFLLLSIPVISHLFKPFFSNKFYPLFIVLSICLHPAFVTFSDSISSDLPFFFFSLFSLLLMNKPNTIPNQILLGVCIFFSYFIRDIGIVLIPTLLTYQLQQKWRSNEKTNLHFYAIPYLMFAILWVTQFLLLPQGGENHYTMLFTKFSFSQLGSGIEYYLHQASSYFFIRIRYLLPLLFIMVAGMLSSWKQNLHFIIYTVLILVILLAWPGYQGIRFIFPLIPFALYFMLKGCIFIYDAFNFNKTYLLLILSVTLIISTVKSVTTIIEFSKIDTNQSYTPEMILLYNFITKNVEENDIIGFFKPRALRLFTGRNAIYTDQDHFAQSNAKYLLIKKTEYRTGNNNFRIIHETNNYLFLIKGSP